MTHKHSQKYKNIALLLVSVIGTIYLSQTPAVHSLLLSLNRFGYLGAFLAGVLLVSSFTVSPAVVILMSLVQILPVIQVGAVAALGAVVGDLLIFRFVKDSLENELESIYNKIDHKHHFQKILHTKYFSWTLPVVGALIIASPLPDELGVSLLGISKMGTLRFLLTTFALNTVHVSLILSAAKAIKGS